LSHCAANRFNDSAPYPKCWPNFNPKTSHPRAAAPRVARRKYKGEPSRPALDFFTGHKPLATNHSTSGYKRSLTRAKKFRQLYVGSLRALAGLSFFSGAAEKPAANNSNSSREQQLPTTPKTSSARKHIGLKN
jgi:hypothetical protein